MNKEWRKEEDFKTFTHAGLACIIVRTQDGALAGFVGIDKNHFLFEANRGDLISTDRHADVFVFALFEAHKGITFSGRITDISQNLAADELWYFGFTCDMTDDLIPGLVGTGLQDDAQEYRNMDYVTEEVKGLAEQLRDMR